ncbi:MAG: prenyltransferase/squalene oxidase repeat-containing protein [Knoellia sp.]
MVRTLAANSNHYNFPASTYFDGGNTIDAILGLDGAKVGLDGADAAFGYLEDNVGSYTGTDFASLYAGPAGKALLGAYAHGADVADFGDVDLVDALLNDSLGAVEPGRFSDLPTDCGYPVCDYSNTIGQSLDLIGIGLATGEVPDVAMNFLLDQQCADGGFRGDLDATTCVSDLDATAFAAQALVGRYGPEDANTVKALDFLASKQAANGSLLNQDGQANANTAGVAAQAFAVGGYPDELARAQSFLASLQFDCTAPASLRGGIAFTAADHATLLKSPTDKDAYPRLLRATPQSTLGLAGGSLLDVTADGSAASAPVLACPKPTPTPTVTPTVTATPTTTDPGTTPTSSASSVPSTSGPGLAYTGASVAWPLTIGALLLLAGGATILLARRRGAHR